MRIMKVKMYSQMFSKLFKHLLSNKNIQNDAMTQKIRKTIVAKLNLK